LQQRLADSLAHATATAAEASGTNSTEALKLALSVLHRDVEILSNRLVTAERATASANMECIIHVWKYRAASAVAAAVPLKHRRLLHACATLQYGIDVQVLPAARVDVCVRCVLRSVIGSIFFFDVACSF
jgi:hypothetical protein